jgi:hypothetical protein
MHPAGCCGALIKLQLVRDSREEMGLYEFWIPGKSNLRTTCNVLLG